MVSQRSNISDSNDKLISLSILANKYRDFHVLIPWRWGNESSVFIVGLKRDTQTKKIVHGKWVTWEGGVYSFSVHYQSYFYSQIISRNLIVNSTTLNYSNSSGVRKKSSSSDKEDIFDTLACEISRLFSACDMWPSLKTGKVQLVSQPRCSSHTTIHFSLLLNVFRLFSKFN